MRLSIPNRFKNPGLHVWCNKCKRVSTSCKCGTEARHVFQSRIWNPNTKRTDIIRTWSGVKEPKDAFSNHIDLVEELTRNDYMVSEKSTRSNNSPRVVSEGIARYIKYLKDEDLPVYSHKSLSKKHIQDQEKKINDFKGVLRANGYNPNTTPIQITEDHV